MPDLSRAAGAQLAVSLWAWSASVFYPARALKRAGIPVAGSQEGDEPVGIARRGLGPYFSARHDEPVLLETPSEHEHLVEEFDRFPQVYELIVRPFSQPLFEEALSVMSRYLPPEGRVLDAGCGPGRELREVARLLPRGEVVGIDLAVGMVEAAHSSARAHGLDNTAFFQADVGELPKSFRGKFDLVYSCLAHHHYPDAEVAAAGIFRVLRPGGVHCVIDPGPAWFNLLSAPLCKLGDPGWIGFRTPGEFRTLFESVGFERTCWIPLLPGLGLAVAQKPRNRTRRRTPASSKPVGDGWRLRP
jgi:ubiquinone/menaquinone biosynthesis C-methylase UbiE